MCCKLTCDEFNKNFQMDKREQENKGIPKVTHVFLFLDGFLGQLAIIPNQNIHEWLKTNLNLG